MKINQILDKIDANQLFVPAFQREYVWKRDNAKDLIASLIRKYPTGTMLTWETNNPPELKGVRQYDPRQGAVRIILDGQQRITTLYLLIRNEIPPYYKESEILKDPRGLYVNIKTLELQYYKQTIMQSDPYWINITDIFKKTVQSIDFIKNIEEKYPELDRAEKYKILDNFKEIENIPDIDFKEQEIPAKASLKEAIDIFYIVNASGVNLTEAELALAQISGYWPQAREIFKKKLEKLKEDGFVFKLDFIIYCLLGVLHNIGSDMTKLHDQSNEERLKEAWKRLDEEVLDYVVNVLRSQAYIDHSDEINSVYALVPIVVYVYKQRVNALTENDLKKVIKWFYYSQIRQRYISQLPQKLDKDIGIVVRAENPFDELLYNIKLERPLDITADEFIGVDVRNALFSLMRWYFKSKNAICFTTGNGIRKNMGKKYSLEWDHIFPYSVLKENGYNRNNRHKYALAQEITNRAILTQMANRRKSAELAENYLAEVKQKFPSALKLQAVPEDETLWKLENFEQFLEVRRKTLAKELNHFLENITITEEVEIQIPLDELISEGESDELEFKSSLRWNYQTEQEDKKLETVILKSISAFSNWEGGTLIIGVNDEGEILGLDHDYRSLEGDKDKFELHLRNLINKTFGKVFATTGISINFQTINEAEICVINIFKGTKPLYLEIADNNGQKFEKFYVRSGNTSQELGLSEISEYIKSHF
ncbi:DUF262 domain-containing protein [Candidatus Gracilibacteria bacterium]|nr:DUF262 domain-containing protein [Candidatus Gracilibacteria bacterium]MCF7896646.1 DUF262 domain-containing protein [Candidatus Gracilibacteria bacterium]